MSDALLSFTPAAIEHLKLSLAGNPAAVAFRLSVRQTGCTGWMYVPELVDAKIDGDFHQMTDGVDIYVANDALSAVKGTMIDYIDVSLGQKQLVYKNPNADSLCGCGESFNLKNSDDESNS